MMEVGPIEIALLLEFSFNSARPVKYYMLNTTSSLALQNKYFIKKLLF